MINITQSAQEKIRDILVETGDRNATLRCYVQGGGCSGFSYGFAIETETPAEDDFRIDVHDVAVIVDSMSAQYLQGATIDFVEELMGSSFVINNPNAVTTCGCGSSFGIG